MPEQIDEFVLANITGRPEDYEAAEQAARIFDAKTSEPELWRVIAYLEDHQDESVGSRVLRGDASLSPETISLVFKEWLKRGETNKIATAFHNAGRLEALAPVRTITDRALGKGLDPYAVKERIAILMFDAGYPESVAITMVLGEEE